MERSGIGMSPGGPPRSGEGEKGWNPGSGFELRLQKYRLGETFSKMSVCLLQKSVKERPRTLVRGYKYDIYIPTYQVKFAESPKAIRIPQIIVNQKADPWLPETGCRHNRYYA